MRLSQSGAGRQAGTHRARQMHWAHKASSTISSDAGASLYSELCSDVPDVEADKALPSASASGATAGLDLGQQKNFLHQLLLRGRLYK